MTDWGVPDWRDKLAYPSVGDLTLGEWWWQFTRRHEEYRKLWFKFHPEQLAWIDQNLDGLKIYAERKGIPLDAVIQAKRDEALFLQPELIPRKFTSLALLNPEKNFSDNYLKFYYYNSGAAVMDDDYILDTLDVTGGIDAVELLENQANERLVISFNLHLPVGPQIRYAEEQLTEAQEAIHSNAVVYRPQISKWPDYLRVIDAHDQGAKYPEIAETLWPNIKKTKYSVRDTLKAARKLQDNFPMMRWGN